MDQGPAAGQSAAATAHRPPRPLLGAALVMGAASLWATFGIFAKHLYDAGFEPLELASVRAAVGFAAIAVIALVRGGAGVVVGWRALPFLAAYGILGYALFTLVFFRALGANTVSVAVALLYTAPAFVLLMSAILWRERVGALRLVALALVLCGVVLVTGAAGALLQGTAVLPPLALALGIASGLTYAIYTMFSSVSTMRYGPTASLFWSFGFATLVFALIVPPHTPFMRIPGHLPALLALGIVPTLIPYALFLAALRDLKASTASMLASIEPVVAATLAALLLHERMDLLQGAGVLLVVAAAALLARQVARPADPEVSATC
ncbi:MAG TPA: DMT family transporter [Longimicrobiales bacterium]|nr:DMT family transporter [Longimicrobiales bacterium]